MVCSFHCWFSHPVVPSCLLPTLKGSSTIEFGQTDKIMKIQQLRGTTLHSERQSLPCKHLVACYHTWTMGWVHWLYAHACFKPEDGTFRKLLVILGWNLNVAALQSDIMASWNGMPFQSLDLMVLRVLNTNVMSIGPHYMNIFIFFKHHQKRPKL